MGALEEFLALITTQRQGYEGVVNSLLAGLAERQRQREVEQARQDRLAEIEAARLERMVDRDIQSAQGMQATFGRLSDQLLETGANVRDPATRAAAGQTAADIRQILLRPVRTQEDAQAVYQGLQGLMGPSTGPSPNIGRVTVGPRPPPDAARKADARPIPVPDVQARQRGVTSRSPFDLLTTTQQRGIMEEQERKSAEEEEAFKRDFGLQFAVPYISDMKNPQPMRQAVYDAFAHLFPKSIGEALQSYAGMVDPAIERNRERTERLLDLDEKTAELEFTNLEFDTIQERFDAILATGFGVPTLTPEQRTALAQSIGIPESDLESWAAQRHSEAMELRQLNLQNQRLQNQLTQVQVKRGNQVINHSAREFEQNEWRFIREQSVLAPRQDAEYERNTAGWYADRIHNARMNGDPDILRMYLEMYGDESQTGQDLETHIPLATLQQALATAETLHDNNMRQLEIDTNYRQAQLDSALLNLAQDRELMPLETAAMRVSYQRDYRQAYDDLLNIPFRSAFENVRVVTQFAQAVPSEFWDNMPPHIRSLLESRNLSPAAFRIISAAPELERDEQRAWDAFMTLTDTLPNEEDRDGVLATASRLLEEAGYDDPTLRQGLLGMLQGAWRGTLKDEWLRELAVFASIGRNDNPREVIKEQIAAWNTLTDNRSAMLQELILAAGANDCAFVFPMGDSMYFQPDTVTSDGTPRTAKVQRNADGSPRSCDAIINEYATATSETTALYEIGVQLLKAYGVDVREGTITTPQDTPAAPGGTPAAPSSVVPRPSPNVINLDMIRAAPDAEQVQYLDDAARGAAAIIREPRGPLGEDGRPTLTDAQVRQFEHFIDIIMATNANMQTRAQAEFWLRGWMDQNPERR